MTLSRCMNALGLLAAPRAWSTNAARSGEAQLRRGIIASVDDACRETSGADGPVELVTGFAPPGLSEPLHRLKESARAWSEGPPPPALVALARQVLKALGVPEPQDGWDSFDVDDR
jgi:hypothetical protein